jgi:hypothetical protein
MHKAIADALAAAIAALSSTRATSAIWLHCRRGDAKGEIILCCAQRADTDRIRRCDDGADWNPRNSGCYGAKMSDDDSEKRAGFVRQRRNLMLICVVLFFSTATKLRIEKLSVFGTEAKIGDPDMVTTCLWVGGFYWLVRYLQYLSGVRAYLRDAVLQARRDYLPDIAEKQLRLNNPGAFSASTDIPDGIVTFKRDRWNFYSESWGSFTCDISGTVETKSKDESKSVSGGVGVTTILVTWRELAWANIKSLFKVLVKSAFFTEYYLPIVLFVAVSAYKAWKMFSGL